MLKITRPDQANNYLTPEQKSSKKSECCLWNLVSRLFSLIGQCFRSIFFCCVKDKSSSSSKISYNVANSIPAEKKTPPQQDQVEKKPSYTLPDPIIEQRKTPKEQKVFQNTHSKPSSDCDTPQSPSASEIVSRSGISSGSDLPIHPPARISSNPPANLFTSYEFLLCSPIKSNRTVCIKNLDQQHDLINELIEEVVKGHQIVSLSFSWPTPKSEIPSIIDRLKEASPPDQLFFKQEDEYLRVRPYAVSVDKLEGGGRKYTYANGMIERFIPYGTDLEGSRYDRNMEIEEVGIFHGYRLDLRKGYKEKDGNIVEYVNPLSLLSLEIYAQDAKELYGAKQESHRLEICEIKGELVVLKRNYLGNYKWIYEKDDTPIEQILLNACHKSHPNDVGIAEILNHESFKGAVKSFIQNILASDGSTTPKLSEFGEAAIIVILKAAKKEGIDIDPTTKKNLFMHAAQNGYTNLLNQMIELYPEDSSQVGIDVIKLFLEQGHPGWQAKQLANKLALKLDDPFYACWLSIANGDKPTASFRAAFNNLTDAQKATLYEAAFHHNNPYVCEPSEVQVTGDQYCVNLMWMEEKENIPQLNSHGGLSPETKQKFMKDFIQPVVRWANKSSGSTITIWVEENLDPALIARAEELIAENVDNKKNPATVCFRNIWELNLVKDSAELFEKQTQVEARKDLLQAVIADHTMQEKKTKFTVSGLLNRAFSAKKLFDKRTMNHLNDLGFVFAKSPWEFNERFQILNGEKQNLLTSYRKVLIDLSIEYAYTNKVHDKLHKRSLQLGDIRNAYLAMVSHLLAKDGRYGETTFIEDYEARYAKRLKDNEDLKAKIQSEFFHYMPAHFGNNYGFRELPFKEKLALEKILPVKAVGASIYTL